VHLYCALAHYRKVDEQVVKMEVGTLSYRKH
jgi:hypothetical protein